MLYLSAVYIHRVHIKKGATDFFTMTYKYAQIFMIFGTQLCKWILIILVNLHFVPCISLTWWCNGDVMLTSLKSCHLPCTWHCHRAAERERERNVKSDVAIQFTIFESDGLQHLRYPSREGLPFAYPWCEGVERTSAERVEVAGPCTPSLCQQLCSGVVIWMHVFVWMVDILNINFEPLTFCCVLFVSSILVPLNVIDINMCKVLILCHVLVLCLRLLHVTLTHTLFISAFSWFYLSFFYYVLTFVLHRCSYFCNRHTINYLWYDIW